MIHPYGEGTQPSGSVQVECKMGMLSTYVRSEGALAVTNTLPLSPRPILKSSSRYVVSTQPLEQPKQDMSVPACSIESYA